MWTRCSKFFLAISAFALAGIAGAYWCPTYIVPWVASSFLTADAGLLAGIAAVDAALSAQLFANSERLTSAIAVLTKQKALTAAQINQTQQQTAENMAVGWNTLAQQKRIKEARFDYGPEFGQGYQACKTLAEREALQKSEEITEKMSVETLNKEVDVLSKQPQSYQDVALERLKQYQSRYCSDTQVKMGLCAKVGSHAMQSAQFASLLQEARPNTPEYQAKVDFINQLAGITQTPIASPKVGIKTQEQQMQDAQTQATIAPALYTLKHIQSEYTAYQQASSMKQLKNEAQKYMGGGSHADAWHKQLAVQNERGLMIELLKLKSFDLAVQYKQYQQQTRSELLLAHLLASEARRSKDTSN